MCSCLKIQLQAVPERVPSARGAITRLCEDLDIEYDLAGQIRLAVTEACTNCVLHAYEGETGEDSTFALEARVEDDDLLVVVRDAGAGITAVRSARAGLGLGLRLMRQAASSMDVTSRPGARHLARDALRASLRLGAPPGAGRQEAVAGQDTRTPRPPVVREPGGMTPASSDTRRG